jgi:hypothetical protein
MNEPIWGVKRTAHLPPLERAEYLLFRLCLPKRVVIVEKAAKKCGISPDLLSQAIVRYGARVEQWEGERWLRPPWLPPLSSELHPPSAQ